MRFTASCLLAALGAASCTRQLTLPPPATQAPGSVQGRLVYDVVGQRDPAPAKGARVALERSGATATANEQGRFFLEGVTDGRASLTITFDENGDGQVDRSRRVALSDFSAGKGRQVELGELSLGKNATVRGRVVRAEAAQARTGHGGLSVVVPETPFLAFTADDGSFTLEGLPEGELTLVALRGTSRAQLKVTVRAGEELRLGALEVAAPTAMPAAVVLAGRVTSGAGAALADVRVVAAAGNTQREVRTDAQGAFSLELVQGVWSLGLEKAGHQTTRLANLLALDARLDLGELVMVEGTSTPLSFATGDGGADGGRLPGPGELVEVVIAGAGDSVRPGEQVTLRAITVGGVAPISFTWRVDGGVVGPSGVTAGEVQLSAPAGCPAAWPLSLTAVDAQGSTREASMVLRVSDPLFASVQPPALAPGRNGEFTAAVEQGRCTGGLEYQWTTLDAPPGVTLAVGATRDRYEVTVPPQVTSGVVKVQLVVVNNVGVRSGTAIAEAPIAGGGPGDAGGGDGGTTTDGGGGSLDAGAGLRVVAIGGSALDGGAAPVSFAGFEVRLSGTLLPASLGLAVATVSKGSATLLATSLEQTAPDAIFVWLHEPLGDSDVATLTLTGLQDMTGQVQAPFAGAIQGQRRLSFARFVLLDGGTAGAPLAGIATNPSSTARGEQFELLWRSDAGVSHTALAALGDPFCGVASGCELSIDTPLLVSPPGPLHTQHRSVETTQGQYYAPWAPFLFRKPAGTGGGPWSTVSNATGTFFSGGLRICRAEVRNFIDVEVDCHDGAGFGADLTRAMSDPAFEGSDPELAASAADDVAFVGAAILDGGVWAAWSFRDAGYQPMHTANVPGPSRRGMRAAVSRGVPVLALPQDTGVDILGWRIGVGQQPAGAPLPTNGAAFDLVQRAGVLYLAYVDGQGHLQVALAPNPVQGFGGASTPFSFTPLLATPLDRRPGCAVSDPELRATRSALYVVWTEDCGGNLALVVRAVQ